MYPLSVNYSELSLNTILILFIYIFILFRFSKIIRFIIEPLKCHYTSLGICLIYYSSQIVYCTTQLSLCGIIWNFPRMISCSLPVSGNARIRWFYIDTDLCLIVLPFFIPKLHFNITVWKLKSINPSLLWIVKVSLEWTGPLFI